MYVLRVFVVVVVLFCLFVFLVVVFFFFRVVVFLLQMIAIIFDDAIYLFIYFLHFISMLSRLSPILKTIQKMGEINENNNNSKQRIIILPMKYERRYHNICWGAVAWWLTPRTQDPEVGGGGVESHLGRRVVSLSKIYLPTKSTGNTEEAVAPSQHDWKIVYRDV